MIAETLDREALWAAQTPQAFRLAALRGRPSGVRRAGSLAAATDEAWLIERAGGRVLLEETGRANFKVTTGADLAAAEALRRGLSAQSRRRSSAVTHEREDDLADSERGAEVRRAEGRGDQRRRSEGRRARWRCRRGSSAPG